MPSVLPLYNLCQACHEHAVCKFHLTSTSILQLVCGGVPVHGWRPAGHAMVGKRQTDTGLRMAQVLWAKGYTELVELMGRHAAREGSQPHIDCYGNGEDLADVAATAKAKRLDLDMKGGIDHLDPSMHEYKVLAGSACSACGAVIAGPPCPEVWEMQGCAGPCEDATR